MDKKELVRLYVRNGLSASQIAGRLFCSANKINYWIAKHKIQKRSISEAVYKKNNPNGDPFKFRLPKKPKDIFLFGLGLGLYWGEGSKRGLNSVRLSNSDPILVKKFIDFLARIYHIDRNKLRFQLQTYPDTNPVHLLEFWSKFLAVHRSQFYKTTMLVHRGEGTYHKKMEHGVLLVYFNNTKLKKLICNQIANIENL